MTGTDVWACGSVDAPLCFHCRVAVGVRDLTGWPVWRLDCRLGCRAPIFRALHQGDGGCALFFFGPFTVLRGCMRVHRMHGESTCEAHVTTCVAYHHGKRSVHHADVLGQQEEGRVSMALWNNPVTGPLATLANLLRHKT